MPETAHISPCGGCGQPHILGTSMREHHQSVTDIHVRITREHQELRHLASGAPSAIDFIPVVNNVLDGWVDLQGQVGVWQAQLNRLLVAARADLRQKRGDHIDSAVNYARGRQYDNHASSIQERSALYDRKVATEQLLVDDIEGLVKDIEELKWHLKRVHEQWRQRILDARWLHDRIAGPQALQRNV